MDFGNSNILSSNLASSFQLYTYIICLSASAFPFRTPKNQGKCILDVLKIRGWLLNFVGFSIIWKWEYWNILIWGV